MKHIPMGGTPASNRSGGIVFAKQGDIFTARATVVPIQPTTNPRTSVTIAAAAVAAAWGQLSPTQQALWFSSATPTVPAYNNFVAANTLQYQWGLAFFDAPSLSTDVAALTFVEVYSEPDGVHMTLASIATGPPATTNVPYVRLQLARRLTQPSGETGSVTVPRPSPGTFATPTYVGSWGPVNFAEVTLFDITDAWLGLFGQWYPPSVLDTTSHSYCGLWGPAGRYYVTDQFGRQEETSGPYPIAAGFGLGPPIFGPGVCPLPTSPPYPWLTAAAFYGV